MDFLSLPRETLWEYWNYNDEKRPEAIVDRVRISMAFELYGQLRIIEHVPNSLLGLAVGELGSFVQQFLRNQHLTSVVDLYDEVLEWRSQPIRPVARRSA